ncbi:hypothetical protein NDU88_007745 [Pleurodeles waltl]|uniref:Uncharacterized protein n=1 Tax=Pleurodeles waltl TaxID=8319 RepID=A0AAV7VVA4_PLEWA|nr:hypothetical protein NDU88_007745 [Pleurodeles waltl]
MELVTTHPSSWGLPGRDSEEDCSAVVAALPRGGTHGLAARARVGPAVPPRGKARSSTSTRRGKAQLGVRESRV